MSLADTILGLAPALIRELESLVSMIVSSKSPEEAIAKAKRNLEMDAMDKATDLMLDAALKKIHHPNG